MAVLNSFLTGCLAASVFDSSLTGLAVVDSFLNAPIKYIVLAVVTVSLNAPSSFGRVLLGSS